VLSLNVGLDWATVVRTLETRSRSRPMPDSNEPGISLSSALKVSKLPRMLSRGLGVVECALWKSVSESSVVPVRAGVRAGVGGRGVSGWSVAWETGVSFEAVGIGGSASAFLSELSARVGVLAPSTLGEI